MKILVLNCGSSSAKYQLYDMPAGTVLAKGQVERIGRPEARCSQKCGDREIEQTCQAGNHDEAFGVIVRMLLDPAKGAIKSVKEIEACGHRVVHGGEAVSGAVRIDDKLESLIESFSDLAPLHNPPNLTGIRAARKALGDIPQVASFDTAFHQTIPETAYRYALPHELYEKYRIRRYGFHGTSHRYVTQRAAAMLGLPLEKLRAITCHLGNGCSITAVNAGKSVDTSMGLTPLEGLVMGTRPGDIDPGIIFYLTRKGYAPDQVDKLLNTQSGLLGLSGASNDMRDLEDKAIAGDARAKLALEVFAYRIRKYIGAYLAVLNGADAIVFTGGIGENRVRMRHRVLEHMDALGVVLDDGKNSAVRAQEAEIQAAESRVKVLVIPTNEERSIALDTYALVR